MLELKALFTFFDVECSKCHSKISLSGRNILRLEKLSCPCCSADMKLSLIKTLVRTSAKCESCSQILKSNGIVVTADLPVHLNSDIAYSENDIKKLESIIEDNQQCDAVLLSTYVDLADIDAKVKNKSI